MSAPSLCWQTTAADVHGLIEGSYWQSCFTVTVFDHVDVNQDHHPGSDSDASSSPSSPGPRGIMPDGAS